MDFGHKFRQFTAYFANYFKQNSNIFNWTLRQKHRFSIFEQKNYGKLSENIKEVEVILSQLASLWEFMHWN